MYGYTYYTCMAICIGYIYIYIYIYGHPYKYKWPDILDIYIATYVIYTWPSLNRLYGMIVCMIICLKCIWPLCIWPHILYIYIYIM